MPDKDPPHSGIILYQTEDGHARIQCRFEDETILNRIPSLRRRPDFGYE
ncbi:MAG: hypothetical protein ACTHMT_07350 [Verrucomicrobiota bacterium]